jgi:hypothetical protein
MEHHPMGSLLDVHGLMLASTQIKCQPRTVTFWGYSDGDRGESNSSNGVHRRSLVSVSAGIFDVLSLHATVFLRLVLYGLASKLAS